MIGISSRSAGVLFVPSSETGEYIVLDVVGGEEQDPIEAQYLYSAAQDWEEIEGSDARALLEIATREYWLDRTVSLLRLAIGGLDFGAGKTKGRYHALYMNKSPLATEDPNNILTDPNYDDSFARFILDISVPARPTPVRKDSYLLISAGPDSRYGTDDDATNWTRKAD